MIKVFTCCSHAWVCLGAVYCSVLLWVLWLLIGGVFPVLFALWCARFLRGFELWGDGIVLLVGSLIRFVSICVKVCIIIDL